MKEAKARKAEKHGELTEMQKCLINNDSNDKQHSSLTKLSVPF